MLQGTILRLRLGGPKDPRPILRGCSQTERRPDSHISFQPSHAFPLRTKTYEIWSDASIDEGGCGTGVGLLFETNQLTHTSVVFAGLSTCSYRGESLAVEKSLSDLLARFTRYPPSKKKRHKILLFTDSCGLTEIRIWRFLLQILKFGVSCHIQFIYSHCGIDRNEMADARAKEMNEAYRRNHPDLGERCVSSTAS